MKSFESIKNVEDEIKPDQSENQLPDVNSVDFPNFVINIEEYIEKGQKDNMEQIKTIEVMNELENFRNELGGEISSLESEVNESCELENKEEEKD